MFFSSQCINCVHFDELSDFVPLADQVHVTEDLSFFDVPCGARFLFDVSVSELGSVTLVSPFRCLDFKRKK